MWLLDNVYPQSKVIKNISKFDDSTWSMKYQLKVDKFLQARVLCSNCLSKFKIKVEIYHNMAQVAETPRYNCWSICQFSLVRDAERLHNIEFEHQLYR